MRGGRGAVTLGKRGHAARALQAGLKGPLVRWLQGVVESVGLCWEVVPQTPVGPERGSREGQRKRGGEMKRDKDGDDGGMKGGEIFNTTYLSYNYIFRNEMCVCAYLRASTLASESASRIPFLMLSTRTAVCLRGRETEAQKVHEV